MGRWFHVACLVWLLYPAAAAHGQDTRPTQGDLKCFFGTLHAHCVLSGDFSPRGNRRELADLLATSSPDRFNIPNGPMAAWTHAATQSKIDFLALTDHYHGGSPAINAHSMANGGYELLRAAADRINNDPRF